ncbi:unannotated protein [freshwater metagenome]|uniref:Unannotated protein n=1 Tax=freshwater metagenome TaxID=449393 RepID=A0A6J7G5K2_9ZZZZ|nr:hypothetical protein [Actinomycetota bacterium]
MAQAQPRVSRDDLEAKFRALQGDIQHKVDDRKQPLVAGAVVGGILLLLVFFVLGKRSGKKRTTLVEIRRV